MANEQNNQRLSENANQVFQRRQKPKEREDGRKT